MMETMIPPQVGMRLRTLQKKRERPKRKKERPKKRENKKGNATISFSTLVLQSSTMFFIQRVSYIVLQSSTMFFIQRVSYVVTFIYQWEFFIIELGLYIPTMGFLKMPQVFMSKQVGCTPTSFLLLSIHLQLQCIRCMAIPTPHVDIN